MDGGKLSVLPGRTGPLLSKSGFARPKTLQMQPQARLSQLYNNNISTHSCLCVFDQKWIDSLVWFGVIHPVNIRTLVYICESCAMSGTDRQHTNNVQQHFLCQQMTNKILVDNKPKKCHNWNFWRCRHRAMYLKIVVWH